MSDCFNGHFYGVILFKHQVLKGKAKLILISFSVSQTPSPFTQFRVMVNTGEVLTPGPKSFKTLILTIKRYFQCTNHLAQEENQGHSACR